MNAYSLDVSRVRLSTLPITEDAYGEKGAHNQATGYGNAIEPPLFETFIHVAQFHFSLPVHVVDVAPR